MRPTFGRLVEDTRALINGTAPEDLENECIAAPDYIDALGGGNDGASFGGDDGYSGIGLESGNSLPRRGGELSAAASGSALLTSASASSFGGPATDVFDVPLPEYVGIADGDAAVRRESRLSEDGEAAPDYYVDSEDDIG